MKQCLVVDDSRVIRRVAAKIVQDLGFAVVEASDGGAALAQCGAQMPDVILLDWDMPDMAGPDVTRAVRAMPGGEMPVIVFCTTRNDPADINEALACGADEYIMKPFDGEIVGVKFLLLDLMG